MKKRVIKNKLEFLKLINYFLGIRGKSIGNALTFYRRKKESVTVNINTNKTIHIHANITTDKLNIFLIYGALQRSIKQRRFEKK